MADEIVKFVGVKETLRILRDVEPDVYKQLRKDIRAIAMPAVTAIKSNTPSVAPLSGMVNNGRTAWTKPKVTVNITPGQRSRGFASTTSNLVAIQATGEGKKVGFDIADMAGRANQPGKYEKSRKYINPYTGEVVRLKQNGQGRALIDNLAGRASRYVYPAIESKLPAIRTQVAKSFDTAAEVINRKLKRV